MQTYPDGSGSSAPAWAALGENAVQLESLNKMIVSYQDPKQVDKLSKIQQELNETTDIMHQTIDKVLERGVKLDDLVDRSADLSSQSKMFYKTAKKHNSCCTICWKRKRELEEYYVPGTEDDSNVGGTLRRWENAMYLGTTFCNMIHTHTHN